MKLVIVESPTKAKTISRFLGKEFVVESSYGHLRDLPKSKLGIDVKKDFAPTYVIPKKAEAQVAILKNHTEKADKVILATDEDREGEAIAWHLVEALDLGNNKEYERIAFHEITKPAIEEALKNPRKIDQHLVDAQQARRVLDRLVGYELSPFLWRKIRYGLSAGRVQSVTVRLVVEREREIQRFSKEEYWTIEAHFAKTKTKQTFSAKLYSVNGKTLGKMEIKNAAQANELLAGLKGAAYTVSDLSTKDISRTPAPPFTTSTLQQEAARRFGFSAKQTMMIAQQLYENGLITYMRTDSLNLATSALAQARAVIGERFGEQYALPEPRFYANRSKGAQEAHEAIRPTDLSKHSDIEKFRDRGHSKLYDLIWKRTVASQMQTALLEQTTATIMAGNLSAGEAGLPAQAGNYVFRASGQVVKFDGFMRAYTEGRDDDESPEEEGVLPVLEKGEKLSLHELTPLQHFTEPPARYTDATLVKALEADGIGRPSTYAPTLSTIQERGYVEKIEKRYRPTEIGFLVNDLLVAHFPEIVDIKFTARIEEEFDEIAEGKAQWVPVIKEFYGPFKKNLKAKEEEVEKQVEISTTPCPHCGEMMLVKFGRNGKFLACPDPKSKITLPLPEEAAKIKELTEKTKDERCPICGKDMKVRRGRFGFFLGCVDYPKCKGLSKIWEKTGFTCPNCVAQLTHNQQPITHNAEVISDKLSVNKLVGDIVLKKSRGRGKPFYACTRYPDCTFVMNKKPESEAELAETLTAWKAKLAAKEAPEEKPKKPPRGGRSSPQVGGKTARRAKKAIEEKSAESTS
ncbi:MAG: DNA topoisomerase I [Candidatus Liptonbacteria bacterium RIFCSPLOWO2_01_FULL_52_25]|uniref:DNA topoisomerase 1 n=1 Tax=Candidatus Liptonbacteria bacterium RIFCSPLOWO2_01_FULL_52_25 TaxID=1798650 RepID=A0A1G2CCL3_9BACT|nr:MAG: DNA topoisomerase I [Candidatus Liptonbacteria bacterium RIFCSPLOWO2_01_FULL_52_25]